MKNATIQTIGISSGMRCIEGDARFVAEQHDKAFEKFDKFDKYPIYDWQVCEPLTGNIVHQSLVKDKIRKMPINKVMKLFISSHGFVHKIGGWNYYCLWFGDEVCWITFNELVSAVNQVCEDNPTIEIFNIWLDTCYAGKARKEIKNATKSATSSEYDILTKAVEPFGKPKAGRLKKVNVHKKVSILSVCSGNQTSYGELSDSDRCPVTTSGHSLGTNSLMTSMNWYYSYGAGLNIIVQGVKCKPRSKKAIMSLAQRRVNSSLRGVALSEWHNWGDKTVWQKYDIKGDIIFY